MPTEKQKPVVTMIRHHHNAAELYDNAATHLTRRGYSVEHRYPFDGDPLLIPDSGVTPTIVLGGGQNVTELDANPYLHDELRWIESCLHNEVPLLGICLGAQLIAHALGAKVAAKEPVECEFGFYTVYPTEEAGQWLPDPMVFMQAHYQEFTLPSSAVRLAYSERFAQQAFSYGDNTYAVQFHPEVNMPVFEDWLADSWPEEMLSIAGAQTRSEQRREADAPLKAQQKWLESTLDNLMGEPNQ